MFPSRCNDNAYRESVAVPVTSKKFYEPKPILTSIPSKRSRYAWQLQVSLILDRNMLQFSSEKSTVCLRLTASSSPSSTGLLKDLGQPAYQSSQTYYNHQSIATCQILNTSLSRITMPKTDHLFCHVERADLNLLRRLEIGQTESKEWQAPQPKSTS